MLTIYSNQPTSLYTKSQLSGSLVDVELGSDAKDIDTTKWFGDLLTVDSLFPQWILKEYSNNPTNVTFIPLIKNYFRWLFSLQYGYGAQLNWEKIRVPLYMDSIFLEALADFYFPGADFSQTALNNILPNIRTFSVKVDANYFNIKGTPQAVKYLICSLVGFNIDDVYVVSTTYSSMEIQIRSSEYTRLQTYDLFLREYGIPAGVVLSYRVI